MSVRLTQSLCLYLALSSRSVPIASRSMVDVRLAVREKKLPRAERERRVSLPLHKITLHNGENNLRLKLLPRSLKTLSSPHYLRKHAHFIYRRSW